MMIHLIYGFKYNYLMLVIENIKIKFQKSVIPVKVKSISVGYNQSYSTNQKKYHQSTTHLFQWQENISLPLYYNVPLAFTCKTDQNYDNPEDPNCLLTSKIKIIDYKQTTSEAALLNKLNKQVATISIIFKVLNQRLIVPQDKGRLIISSILAHFQNHYGSKGFMEISIGFKTLFTPTVNVIAGQLLWSEELAIPLEQTNSFRGLKQQITMKIIVDEKIIGCVKFLAETAKTLQVKYKKFKICDVQDQKTKVGTLFLDITYNQKVKVKKQGQKPLKLNNQYSLSLKKVSYNQFSQRQLFTHPNQTPVRSEEKQKQSSRSERMLPILPSNSSQALLKINSQMENRRKKKSKESQLFQGVFNLGTFQKSQNIREILKQRRHKKQTNGSLPKLK